ncbi:hypothetical protein FJZ55_00840 [Candidatus Woesearchaeota archaeon]|nr:hypothetical protein [Candidatus Woesearchaeota archaeon]
MPLIHLLFQICIFRKGPQDVPASLPLLVVTLLLYLVMGVLLLAQETGWLEGILRTLAEATLLGGFLWTTLRLMDKRPRLLQTAIAVYASDALVSSVALPLLLLMASTPEAKPVYLLLLGLMIWHWAVMGHILRHAVSVRWVHGVGLAMAYMVLSYRIMSSLFPAGTA